MRAHLVGGAILTGRGQVLVTESLLERPRFDSALYSDVGWRIEKPDRKEILVTLKMRINVANTTVAGVPSALEKARLQTTLLETKDMRPRCVAGGIAVFEFRGSIKGYEPRSDVLQYFFRFDWRALSGGAKTTTIIDAEPPLLYFSMRASETSREWGHPWGSYATCG